MFRNEEGMARNSEMNATFIGNNNTIENEMNMGMGDMSMADYGNMDMGSCCGGMQRPMYSPVQQRCIHKTIVHEVPQV